MGVPLEVLNFQSLYSFVLIAPGVMLLVPNFSCVEITNSCTGVFLMLQMTLHVSCTCLPNLHEEIFKIILILFFLSIFLLIIMYKG